MDKKKFVNIINEIQMPKDMQQRIIEKCYIETEKKRMNKMFKKPMVAVASFAVCVCLMGVTALAATGKLEGYFRDIKRWDGAVVGTAYEQATDEVEMNIIEVSDKLVVEITMVNFKEAPYSFFEMFGIKNYKIVDANGKVIVENENLEMSAIANNKVLVNVPLDDVGNGEYTLIVSELVGGSKADQPLGLDGTWECSFRR
ncbi:MAG: hypothetical protein IKY94_10955 [Lachnospiraceae bacterium]|nr:hypothetical protein [Lachnospiraceae bacterium]